MTGRANRFNFIASILIAGVLSPLSWSQTGQTPPDKAEKSATQTSQPQIDAGAKALLDKARQRIANAKTASAKIVSTLNINGSLVQQKMESHYDFALQRPDKIAVVLKDGMMGETMVSDGKEIFTYMPMMKQYTKTEAPQSIQAMVSDEEGMIGMGSGPLSLVGPVLLADTIGGPQSKVISLQDAGTEKAEGHAVHRIKLSLMSAEEKAGEKADQENDDKAATDESSKPITLDMDLLIQEGDQPTVQEIDFDLTKMLQQMMKENGEDDQASPMRDMKYKQVVSFAGWKFDEELPAETFAFSPPEGAKLASSLDDDAAEPEQQHPLAGKPAPSFELPTLEGKTVTLDQFKDKDIVVLDFWATWCGPCVKALPELMDVMKDYRDKGVVFYAVDLREDDAKVQNFIKKKNWELNVLMDKQGEVAKSYMVNGIPQTVIIGKDGKVQTVHIGYTPNIKKRTRDELDALLGGKNLYQAAPAKPVEEEPQP